MATYSRDWERRYLRSSNIGGNVYELLTAAGAAANNTTVARYAVGGLTTTRRWRPTQTTTTDNPVPVVGTAPADDGWREAVSEFPDDPFETPPWDEAGEFFLRLRYRRSGQALEVDQVAEVTAIVYRVSSGGAFGEEVVRYAETVSFTTATQTTLIDIGAGAALTSWAAGDKLQVEVYVTTTVAGAPTPPAVATDLWLVINETEANSGSGLDPPNYRGVYTRAEADSAAATDSAARVFAGTRAPADTAGATDALQRQFTGARALADSIPMGDTPDTIARVYTGARALADTADASDQVDRVFAGTRAPADTAGASDDLARTAAFPRALADDAPVNADTLTRTVNFIRALSESIPLGADTIARIYTGIRALADTAAAADDLARVVNYVRALTDELASGIIVEESTVIAVFDD